MDYILKQVELTNTHTPYFSEDTLQGKNADYSEAINNVYNDFSFDFVALGLTPTYGAPLRWIYRAGSVSKRTENIALVPGHGIGGIVIKSGKPMLLSNINTELNSQDYSSFPIVFAEDLHCFCALPLLNENSTVAVLLCAFRDVKDSNANVLRAFVNSLNNQFLGFKVISQDFLDLDFIRQVEENDLRATAKSYDLSQTIASQEAERKRISNQLHDSISQELLAVTMQLNNIIESEDERDVAIAKECQSRVNNIIEEMHNLSVELRPSALDNFGLTAALRTQSKLYESYYGNLIVFDTNCDSLRFDKDAELQIFRIAQEAIVNSCKYSNSEEIVATVEYARGELAVVIADKGTGFDTKQPIIQGGGCGLQSMRERAELIGAQLSIVSNDNGTRVSLSVPLTIVEGDQRD